MARAGATAPTKPHGNDRLAALPAAELPALGGQLEPVELELGRALRARGQAAYVYFPTTAVVSLLYVLENGSSTELAVTGREGVVGISLFMGGETTPSRAVVQIGGRASRTPARALKRAFEGPGALQELLLRFTQALITQMTQTAVCNRHHQLDQQLCRWLLLSLDRLRGTEVRMTQQLIANMLGVRREGVTAAARKLQAAGAIRYQRGRIEVLDRAALEARVCECYRVVKREYQRLLGGVLRRATLAPRGVSSLNLAAVCAAALRECRLPGGHLPLAFALADAVGVAHARHEQVAPAGDRAQLLLPQPILAPLGSVPKRCQLASMAVQSTLVR